MSNNQVIITSLYRAAIDGDLVSLQNLLATHANLLKQFAGAGPYKETPLHVAVQLGHTQVVKEMIDRKPELSSKLDSLRSSPLHLAAAAAANYKDSNRQLEMVKLLLNANPEMCSVHDKFGNNPMHVAAVNGVDVVIKAMIQAWPVAAKQTAKHGNTILHLCVKHGQLEALKVLLQLFGVDHEFVNSKNDDGDTILHLAAANKQTEIFEYLIRSNKSMAAVEVSSQNLKGWTAFNILASEQLDMELEDNPAGSGKHDVNVDAPSKRLEAAAANNNDNAGLIKDMKKTIMLVSTLIAGMAFQAMINPPGGLFQVSPTDDVVVAAELVAPAPATVPVLPLPVPGTPVMAFYKKSLYNQYSNANTISFVTSLANIIQITTLGSSSFGQRRVFLWLVYPLGGASIGSLSNAYSYALLYNSGDVLQKKLYDYATMILCLTGILLWALWHFKNYVLKKASSSSSCPRRRRRQTPTTSAHNNNHNRVTV